MNYDFSEKELTFITDIETCINAFAETAGSADRDLAVAESNLRKALGALAATGYTGLGYRNTDTGSHTLMAAMEKIAAAAPSLYLGIEMNCRVFGRLLATWAPSGWLKEDLLKQVIAGKTVGAVALSEGAMNVENQPLETGGSRDGDLVVVSGSKNFVINGPVADQIAVCGHLEDKAAVFIIPKDAPGLVLGERLATAGCEGSAVCGLTIDKCRVPSDRVITGLDAAKMLSQLRLWENQVLIGASLGALKSAFETARDYAKSHKTGGKPAIAYQSVAFKLSEMLTLYQTAQLFAYRSGWTYDTRPKEAESLTWCAKVFCSEASETVAGNALQILSGEGLLAGNPAEKAYRNAKLTQVCGTSTEIARVKIGDLALGFK